MKNTMLTAESWTGDPVDPQVPTSARRFARRSSLVHPRQGKIPAIKRALAGFAAWALLGAAASASAGLVHRWSFNGTANDSVGTAHGTLFGTATISDGKLSLSGSSETNRMQATLGNALGPNKTLVAWCSLSSLTPNNAAGSPLSVLNASGSFDAIVYGERTGGQWMNGSEFWSRTPANNGGALETLAAPNEIMMAITYDSYATNKIKLYRNGVLYAEHNLGSGVSLEAGANVLIGPRDQTQWNDGYMNGAINEARIYNYALTDVEIQGLNTLGPDTLPVSFNITASAGTGGTISPDGVTAVAESTTPTYTITPGIGYDIADVVLDGTTSLGAVTTYTFAPVTAAHTIAATFVAVAPHTITASADTGGSISPDGAVSVAHRDSRTYTITPAIGYNIADVVLDGTTSLGAVTTYTFAPVTAAHTIAATFVAVAPHTITASADTGGSISPDGAVSVAHRDSQAFTITPDSGYLVADVVLDGTTSLGTVTTYTFANVQTDHTISATFVAKSLVHQWSFNDGTANDSVGTAHGTLFGNTLPAITGGKLVLNPGSDQNQYMKTSAFTGETLGKRTLVAWVALSNLDQPGGAGVLGIHPAGVDNFDSIVYGERVAKQWMNGSSLYYRTVANNGGALETSTDEVMMAIVYDSDNSIKLYRNGVRYDTGANQGTLVTRTAPIAVLGRRAEGTAEDLQGSINEARIYNYALTASEVAALYTQGPDTQPGGYAAWAADNGFDPDHPEAVGNDGLTNLMVYALALKTDGTNGSPGTLAGNVLSFTKRPEAVTNGDVTYAIEVSTDLGGTDPWHVTTTGVTEVAGPPATISIDLSALGGTWHFARLKVTQE